VAVAFRDTDGLYR